MDSIVNGLLPIGTVCTLRNNKKIMITGFLVHEPNDNKTYDYCGCIYPLGFTSSKETFVFNNENILKIDYMGFVNEDEKKLKQEIYEAMRNSLNMDGNNQ